LSVEERKVAKITRGEVEVLQNGPQVKEDRRVGRVGGTQAISLKTERNWGVRKKKKTCRQSGKLGLRSWAAHNRGKR